MRFSKIPCFYFPTRVLLVDDDLRLIEQLALPLSKNTTLDCESSPERVQTLATQTPIMNQVLKPYFPSFLQLTSDAHGFFDNSAELSHLAAPERFDIISVLITDSDSKRLSAIEINQQFLNQTRIKRIMLTNSASFSQGVDLINQGLLNCFLHKGMKDQSLVDELTQLIRRLKLDYFLESSEGIFTALTANVRNLLNDKQFIELMNSIIQTNHIVEFYLIDQHGSFLLLDKFGQCHWLLLKPLDVITAYCADIYSDIESKNAYQALKNHQLAPLVLSSLNIELTPTLLNQSLFPAERCRFGKVDYVKAFIIGRPDYLPLDICSFNQS